MTTIKVSIIFLAFLFLPRWCFSQLKDCRTDSKNTEFLEGTWIGQFEQYSCGVNATYPMTIEIQRTKKKKFSGIFIWDDLPYSPDSKSKLEGTRSGETLDMQEGELISGGNIVLNGTYETEILDCNTLQGIWRTKKLQPNCPDRKALVDGGRFRITKLVPHEEVEKKEEIDKRKVIIKEEIEVRSSKYLTLKIWDNDKEDGDIITLRLNGQLALREFQVKKKPHEIIIPIDQKENLIELYAENLGTIPPNTAAIAVVRKGKVVKSLVLASDMGKSEAILIRQK